MSGLQLADDNGRRPNRKERRARAAQKRHAIADKPATTVEIFGSDGIGLIDVPLLYPVEDYESLINAGWTATLRDMPARGTRTAQDAMDANRSLTLNVAEFMVQLQRMVQQGKERGLDNVDDKLSSAFLGNVISIVATSPITASVFGDNCRAGYHIRVMVPDKPEQGLEIQWYNPATREVIDEGTWP